MGPVSSGSSSASGYTKDCSKVPAVGRFLSLSDSLQTPWRLQTAPSLSSSCPTKPGGQVGPPGREGSSLRGRPPGQTAVGGRGLWGPRTPGSRDLVWCRCGWHLMNTQPGVKARPRLFDLPFIKRVPTSMVIHLYCICLFLPLTCTVF